MRKVTFSPKTVAEILEKHFREEHPNANVRVRGIRFSQQSDHFLPVVDQLTNDDAKPFIKNYLEAELEPKEITLLLGA